MCTVPCLVTCCTMMMLNYLLVINMWFRTCSLMRWHYYVEWSTLWSVFLYERIKVTSHVRITLSIHKYTVVLGYEPVKSQQWLLWKNAVKKNINNWSAFWTSCSKLMWRWAECHAAGAGDDLYSTNLLNAWGSQAWSRPSLEQKIRAECKTSRVFHGHAVVMSQ